MNNKRNIPDWDWYGRGFDEWKYMPKWKKALYYLFAMILPVVGSIDSIQF